MTQIAAAQPARPRFSIVTSVYDVEPYLPAFIDSVERLRVQPGDLEIIAVDDGSTDGSLDLLREWGGRSRHRVKLYTKPNGGLASARNLGLEHATGEWVTFPDPDDLLDRDYLRAADRFASSHPEIAVMSAQPVILTESTGSRGRHPRSWQYASGTRTADLTSEPSVFLGLSPGSFFRLDRIRAANLTFDARIKPSFEDAHFAVRYLLALPRPMIGLLRDSVYVYRKRAAGNSLMQRSMGHPGRYSDVLELGYLDIIERGRRADGSVHAWIQQLIVYELSWYLSGDERISTTVRVPPELAPRFHELLDRILRELDPAVVMRHRSRALDPVWRDLLARAGRGVDWHSPAVVNSRVDQAMGLRRFNYRYVGHPPLETFRAAAGEAIQPAFQKTMAHRYFGRDFLWERILWLPDVTDLEIALDGDPVDQSRSWANPGAGAPSQRRPAFVDRLLMLRDQGPRYVRSGLARRAGRVLRNGAALPPRFAARCWPFRARFRDAWVLMDRIHDADDNGERLFEHLRASRTDTNAWFVLDRRTPDWERLWARGERRLVAHGSWAWKMLMLNCTWLLSSHIDQAIVRPPEILRVQPKPSWRFGFLQHGVTKDDLARWLNRVEVDLAIVSTEAELASVVGDGTAYRWTAKEMRNTGLPRFDRLLAKGDAVPAEQRDLVIVAPTWRQWLTQPLAPGSQRRELDSAFWDSDYLQSWTALLSSPKIARAVVRRGWRLGFMPHPNLQSMLGRLDLPAHVEPLSFAGVDVQELYARCGLLVTDYSSVAFNIAYLDRPVVYFQFDRDAMLGGYHVGRKGYFEYERDGFGPVAEDLHAAELAIVAAIERGPRPTREYQRRIAATFPIRDGQACARVVAAIEEMSRPWIAGTV